MKATVMPVHMFLTALKNIVFSKRYSRKPFVTFFYNSIFKTYFFTDVYEKLFQRGNVYFRVPESKKTCPGPDFRAESIGCILSL